VSNLSIAEAAEDLVERSRLGDQNAMALIAEVGRISRAPAPPEAVKTSYAALLAYMKAHPAKDGFGASPRGTRIGHDARRVLAAFGAIPELPVSSTTGPTQGGALAALLCKLPFVGGSRANATAVVIVSGLSLPPDVTAQTAAALPSPEASAAFTSVVQDPSAIRAAPPELQSYALAASILSLALRLQAFCAGAPVSVFSPDMGWELGETE
jgi:hypothetical protein